MKAELLDRLATLSGVEISEGAFAPGPAVWVGKREIAHFDGDRSLDVRLTRAAIRDRRSEFRADERIALRPSSSDWLEVRIEMAGDVEFALSLVEEAIAANRRTAPPGRPPSGVELYRRRRFH